MAKERYDFVIVGAGSTGGVVAKELADNGLSVAILDAGPRYNPEVEFVNDEAEMMKLFWNEPRVVTGHDPVGPMSGQGVGGGGLVWCGVTPRFHESDFETYTRDGVGNDWPFKYADLEPYYAKVEKDFGIAGNGDNPYDAPRSGPYPMPGHPMSWQAKVMARGVEKLGGHALVAPIAVNSREYDGRAACVYCGWCVQGCPINAKASSLVTYIPKAEAKGAKVIPGSFVYNITYSADRNRVTGVEYVDDQGNHHEIEAGAVVVTGHSYETPRLLLLSANSAFPNGLANSSGYVGKNFMTHPNNQIYGRFPEPVNFYKGIPMGQIMTQDWYETDPKNDFARGWGAVSFGVMPFYYGIAGPDIFGAELKRFFKDYRYMAGWWTVVEALPNENSTITLDPDVKDHRGFPVARLTHEWLENDKRILQHSQKKCQEMLYAAGAVETYVGTEYAAHPMGTVRLGADPKTSVLNQYCQSWDIPNLFVADTSTFPTGAAVNSTLTAMAIAQRATEFMVQAARKGELS
jgi:choline dehydrogenase-like flavoprotein